jgi:hypothetical protein
MEVAMGAPSTHDSSYKRALAAGALDTPFDAIVIGKPIMADIANYTDIAPQILISEMT